MTDRNVPFAKAASPAAPANPKTVLIGWEAMISTGVGHQVPLLKFAHVVQQGGNNVIVVADLPRKTEPYKMKAEIENGLYAMSHMYNLNLRGLRIEFGQNLPERLALEGTHDIHIVIDTKEGFLASGGFIEPAMLGRVGIDGSIPSLPLLARYLGVETPFTQLLQASDNRAYDRRPRPR